MRDLAGELKAGRRASGRKSPLSIPGVRIGSEKIEKAILLRSIFLSFAEIGRVLGVRPETLRRMQLRIGSMGDRGSALLGFLARRHPAFAANLWALEEEPTLREMGSEYESAEATTRHGTRLRADDRARRRFERFRRGRERLEYRRKKELQRRRFERLTGRVLKRGPVRISARGIITFLSERGSRGRRQEG